MSQELVGRLDEVLALLAKADAAREALPGVLTTPESVQAYDVAADAATDLLRTHGQQIRQALAANPSQGVDAAMVAKYEQRLAEWNRKSSAPGATERHHGHRDECVEIVRDLRAALAHKAGGE